MALALAGEAFGRAGGGGGFSGGGGGGGFSGGGGGFSGGGYSGGGSGADLPPAVLIPIIVLVIIIAIVSAIQKAKQSHRGSVIRRGGRALGGLRRQEAVARLKETDSQFDETAFYNRARDAFVKIQAAWSEQNIDAVRAFVSDGIFERFALQIEEQRDLGYRNIMDNVTVTDIGLTRVDREAGFDVAALRISASAVDYRVRLDNAREISGFRRDEHFTEYWSFIRRSGRQTETGKPGLIEGFCPNCGADIKLNRSARCDSCDSLVRSGEFDWVLAEITQECEWSDFDAPEPAPVAAYRQSRDAGFSIQHLEDRTSVIFWRKVMADRLSDIGPLQKMASSDFCEDYQQQLGERTPTGDRRYVGDCAVGSVELRGIVCDGELDRALVAVRWSGSHFVASDGRAPKRLGSSGIRDQLFVLGRTGGVQTQPENTLSSAHCPGCGAPEANLTSHACEFCGLVLNDGTQDWVLFEILARYDPRAEELTRQSRQATQTPPDPVAPGIPAVAPVIVTGAEFLDEDDDVPQMPQGAAFLAWAIKMAAADKHIDDGERKMLAVFASRRGVDGEQLDTLIDAALRDRLEMPRPSGMDQAKRWLTAMADISLADGKLRRSEFNLLRRAGSSLKMTDKEVKQLLRNRQRELYHQAKEAIREERTASNGSD
jgi:uncharacterized tellurite resistance protein B-like protein